MPHIRTGIVVAFGLGPLAACAPAAPPSPAAHELGEQVSLAIGQSAAFQKEDLSVKFLDVTEDSRCPKGATCVWEGRAVSSVEVASGGVKQTVDLTRPGLTDDRTATRVGGYDLAFDVTPYPEIGKQIGKAEYRLQLVVTRRP